MEELWKNNVSHLNYRCFADAVRRPPRIVHSNDRDVGCAYFVAIEDMPASYKAWYSMQVKLLSSTWRKPHCITSKLNVLERLLSECSFKLFTDKQAVLLIVHSGRIKQH